MLRTMLYEGAKERVPLRTEIELVNNYIDLERLRFGERVDVSLAWNGADESHAEIAPLLLLPFVENAFKHGVGSSEGEAWISLETRITSDVLTFRLVNSKPEETNPTRSKQPCGLGLQNVRKRLELLYKGNYTLSINNEHETFIVVLTIPLATTFSALMTNSPMTNDHRHALLTH
jgi:LytS/YehU family sensor histidine kinase